MIRNDDVSVPPIVQAENRNPVGLIADRPDCGPA
jgi:hypothetical protein